MNGRMKTFMKMFLSGIGIIVVFWGLKVSIQDLNHEKIVMENLRFVEVLNGQEISFAPWKAGREKTYYVVLPSAYKGEKLEAEVSYNDSYYAVYIDGEKYPNGTLWEEALEEKVHNLVIKDCFGKTHMESPFQILVSDNVPSIFVTVEAKDELLQTLEYANKQYVETGELLFLDEEGEILLTEHMERFKVRGNLTSNMDKKPFTITTTEPVSFFGMSKSQNWHLLANATDGSHIRRERLWICL